MPRLKRREHPKPSIPIAPMIDCVFLMLIYFMVTSSLEQQEADIAFQLPGLVEQSDPLELPDEQIIELDAAGQVVVNEYRYDAPRRRTLCRARRHAQPFPTSLRSKQGGLYRDDRPR